MIATYTRRTEQDEMATHAQDHGFKTLHEMAEHFFAEAERLDEKGEQHFEESDALREKFMEISRENWDRIAQAKAREADFTEDQWQDGLDNANDTYTENRFSGQGVECCEYWECVVGSAEIMRDCN